MIGQAIKRLLSGSRMESGGPNFQQIWGVLGRRPFKFDCSPWIWLICGLIIGGVFDFNLLADQIGIGKSEGSPIASSYRIRKRISRRTNNLSSTPVPWIVSGTTPNSGFGESIAGQGDMNGDGFDDLVVGVPNSNDGHGKILIYLGGPNGLGTKPDAELNGNASDQSFGATVAFAGDVNGDGFDEVLVRTSIRHGDILQNTFRLFSGSPNGLELVPAWKLLPEQTYVEMRIGMGVGDLNGDGYADGAFTANAHIPLFASDQHVVLIFYGSPSGFKTQPGAVLTAESNDSMYGISIAGAGDVNGDGLDDLIVGANGFTSQYPQGGKAYVYHGSRTSILNTPSWTAVYDLPVISGVDDPSLQEFGASVCSAGDLNHDGYADVVVGAPFAERWDRDEGMVFVYLGSANGLSKAPAVIIESNQRDALFGWSVSGAGDLNGDGFDDLIVGAPQAAQNRINEGGCVAFYGRSNLSYLRPSWSRLFGGANEFFGRLVIGAGDFNGDGYADVLMAAPSFSKEATRYGRITIEYGSSKGLSNSSNWSFEKSLLATLEEGLNRVRARIGTVVYWGPPVAFLSVFSLGLLWVQRNQQRRIQVLLAENRELILATERARIARDIHDHLGADVTQLVIRAEQMQGSGGQTETDRDELEEITNSARRVVDTIGELVWATDPVHDTLESFISYLAEFAEESIRLQAMECRLDLPITKVEGHLTAVLRHNLFLLTKEILHNVVKHSRASRINLVVRVENDQLYLSISDNGIGFAVPEWLSNPDTPLPSIGDHEVSGRGLRNLAARAREIRARLTIENLEPSGTLVTLVANWKCPNP